MAKIFKFRLQTVERVRRQQRDRLRRVVGDAAGEVVAVQRRIARLTQARAESLGGTRDDLQTGLLDVPALRLQQYCRGTLDRSIENTQVLLQERNATLLEARSKLAMANQHLKAIEKLHARRLDQHAADVHRAELAAMDETAVQRYRTTDAFIRGDALATV